MKILDNGSVGSPSPREIILNGEDLEKLVSSGELQAGPITIRFEKADGEGFGFSRSKSWSSETTGSISNTSDNWSSSTGQSWGTTTSESRRKDEGNRKD